MGLASGEGLWLFLGGLCLGLQLAWLWCFATTIVPELRNRDSHDDPYFDTFWEGA